MKKLTMLAGALTLALLNGCNSSDQALEITPRETTSPNGGAVALRNMATDIGTTISAPNAVDVPAAEGVGNLIDGDPNSKF